MVDLNLSRIAGIANLLQVSLAEVMDVNKGDMISFHSYKNSSEYQVQSIDVIKINKEDAKSDFIKEFKQIANSLISNITSKKHLSSSLLSAFKYA